MKNELVIGLKIKQKGVKWEDIENSMILRTPSGYDYACEMANYHAQSLADGHNAQVRWEFAGIGQGHYVDPKPMNTMVRCSDCGEQVEYCMCVELLGIQF